MSKYAQNFIRLIAVVFIIIFSLKIQGDIFAQETDVSATVKTSVCGNGVTEGDEECDNHNLNQTSCSDLGYQGGSLLCSPACEFDISRCGPPIPTATLTPTLVTTTPANDENNMSGSDSVQLTGLERASERAAEQSRLNRPFEVVNKIIQILLPANIMLFDANDDGKLTYEDVEPATKKWTNEMRRNNVINRGCDLDHDNYCDLVDFSILMYYIER